MVFGGFGPPLALALVGPVQYRIATQCKPKMNPKANHPMTTCHTTKAPNGGRGAGVKNRTERGELKESTLFANHFNKRESSACSRHGASTSAEAVGDQKAGC